MIEMLPILSKGYAVSAAIQVIRRLESGDEWTLYEITGGQITPQETLNNIFCHFCIGK